ncbi:group 1 glycosyl transferase [Paenarthrobacter nicotinovorans]|uniref:glycosyltransferase n=1 Tax=Paenarthrobacter nicotinovorans TaxID=29320 RepID=UPI0007CCDE03|nr:glycosyltransferase [Paenarthrobacter nicotinovorans]GAT85538.1 group 1 glycosyl transferase [Paenarthrobacter nicotinovorans]
MTTVDTDTERPVHPLVVHEWFASIGGSENVANAIRQTFEGSDLLCLWKEKNVQVPGAGRVLQTVLARKPFHGRKVLCLPLMPFVWRWTAARKHDSQLAVVSSHLFAHHVALPRKTRKILYVHTPARYIWEPEYDSRGQNLLIRAVAAILKPIDRKRASEAYDIAANSEFVRERIIKAWGLHSRVIYPPVEVEEIQAISEWASVLTTEDRALLDALPESFVLGASRFIPYKRLDLSITAGEIIKMPVVIAGGGPEEDRLRQLALTAEVDVHFVIAPSNSLLRALYQRASVYVFPPIEDFGIMPVEAMAVGTPVVSNELGGASESVLDGVTGAHFRPDDRESLHDALRRALDLDRDLIAVHALKFSRKRFESEVRAWVSDTYPPV